MAVCSYFIINITSQHITEVAIASNARSFKVSGSDIIFTFGIQPARYTYSEQLYNQSNGIWIISTPFKYLYWDYIKKGHSRISVIPFFTAKTTRDEILALDSIVKSLENHTTLKNQPRLILVSSPSHIARIQLTFERLSNLNHYDVHFVGTPDDLLPKPDNFYSEWWKYTSMWKEVFKFIGYYILYW